VADQTRSTAGTTSGPAHVELLLAFTNSVDNEEQTDDLTSREELTQWLAGHGLLTPPEPSSPGDLSLARRLRDALRDAMRGHHDGVPRREALDSLAPELPVVLDCSSEPPGLRPARDGVPGALARLAVAVNQAVADDTWRRLKICAADDCQWAFFDASKNRSRTWCEWGCGNKLKTRNYRARRKAALSGG
jgi:predicted RNA-binding Zn ribbon-like protein